MKPRPDPGIRASSERGIADDGDALRFCSTCAFSEACLSQGFDKSALGELHVRQQDVEALLAPALRHRFILNFEGESERTRVDDLARECFARALRG